MQYNDTAAILDVLSIFQKRMKLLRGSFVKTVPVPKHLGVFSKAGDFFLKANISRGHAVNLWFLLHDWRRSYYPANVDKTFYNHST